MKKLYRITIRIIWNLKEFLFKPHFLFGEILKNGYKNFTSATLKTPEVRISIESCQS